MLRRAFLVAAAAATGGGREEPGPPAPSASPRSTSARVQLEVAILASDPTPSPARDPASEIEDRQTRRVLVVAEEADTRFYIRHCLRGHPNLLLFEVGSVAVAMELARYRTPDLLIVDLLIVDGLDADLFATLPAVPAILIVDEAPAGGAVGAITSNPPRVWLARPFNARALIEQVERLIR